MRDLDLVIANLNDYPKVLRNDGGNANNWLKIDARLRGGKSTAVGARITVKTGKLTQILDLSPVTGYLSQMDPRPNFGLGKAGTVDSVMIRWPDGKKTELRDVGANRILQVIQDEK